MFGLNRWSPIEDVFNFQREVDRLFNQFWTDLSARTSSPAWSPTFQVHSTEDAWRVEVPLPGVDPANVDLEVAGQTLTIRVKEPGADKNAQATRWEQSLTVPQFLDLEKISAAHQHGMLRLTLPLKESVKPRRIQIEAASDDKKQLPAAA